MYVNISISTMTLRCYVDIKEGVIMPRFVYSLLLAIVTLPVYAGENILTPMLGITSWSDDTGHIGRGTTLDFTDSNQTTLGFRYLYLFDNGVALGGDFYMYDKDISAGQANDAGVLHTHALVEYFFNHTSNIMPFIGFGIGVSAIGFDGGNMDGDGTGGSSYEVNGGVLFRLNDLIGVQVEYKYTDFNMDEDIDVFTTNIDSSAHTILLGLTIHI